MCHIPNISSVFWCSNEWKIQINMHVNFVSSNDAGEARTVFGAL